MKNFENYIIELEFNDLCFDFLKKELQKNFSFQMVENMLSLPCMRYETGYKLSIIFALLEDKRINDNIVELLTKLLLTLPEDLWSKHKGTLRNLLEKNDLNLNKSQLLMLAHSIEEMYTMGYEETFELANLLFQRISLEDSEFNPDSDINTRIKLAKIAYSTTVYNINEKLAKVKEIKRHLKNSGRNYLMSILNYYKGLCLKAAGHRIEYKDAAYYIKKSALKEFTLASSYLEHARYNFETSKRD